MPQQGTPFPFPARGLTSTGFLPSQKQIHIYFACIFKIFINFNKKINPHGITSNRPKREPSPLKHFRRKRRGRNAGLLVEEVSEAVLQRRAKAVCWYRPWLWLKLGFLGLQALLGDLPGPPVPNVTNFGAWALQCALIAAAPTACSLTPWNPSTHQSPTGGWNPSEVGTG